MRSIIEKVGRSLSHALVLILVLFEEVQALSLQRKCYKMIWVLLRPLVYYKYYRRCLASKGTAYQQANGSASTMTTNPCGTPRFGLLFPQ